MPGRRTTRYECHCCPYGGLASITCVFSFVATFFSFVSCYGCTLFRMHDFRDDIQFNNLKPITHNSNPNYNQFTMNGSLGYYFYNEIKYNNDNMELEGTCVSLLSWPGSDYDILEDNSSNNNHRLSEDGYYSGGSEQLDGHDIEFMTAFPFDIIWRIGRVTATLLTLFSIANFIHIFLMTCFIKLPSAYVKALGIIIILTGVFHLLLLIGLVSQFCYDYTSCSLGSGGILAILSMVNNIVVGTSMFFLKERHNQYNFPERLHHQQYNDNNNIEFFTLQQQLQQQNYPFIPHYQQQQLRQQQQVLQQQQLQQQQQQAMIKLPMKLQLKLKQFIINGCDGAAKENQDSNENCDDDNINISPCYMSTTGVDDKDCTITIEMTETPAQADGTISRTITIMRINEDKSKTIQIITETDLVPLRAAPSSLSSSTTESMPLRATPHSTETTGTTAATAPSATTTPVAVAEEDGSRNEEDRVVTIDDEEGVENGDSNISETSSQEQEEEQASTLERPPRFVASSTSMVTTTTTKIPPPRNSETQSSMLPLAPSPPSENET